MTHGHSSVKDWLIGAIFDIEKTKIFLTTNDDERQCLLVKVWHRERECFECVLSILILKAPDSLPIINQVHERGSHSDEQLILCVLN